MAAKKTTQASAAKNKGTGAGAGTSGTTGGSAAGQSGQGAAAAKKTAAAAAKPKAEKVTNNDKEVATAKSPHWATTLAATDNHFSVKDKSVLGFDNYSPTTRLTGGSTQVLINKASIWLKDTGRVGPTDPIHDDYQPGTETPTYKHPAKAHSSSLDVDVEGQKILRYDDETRQNAGETAGNTGGRVKTAPVISAIAGRGKNSADGKDPCVKLGVNKVYKEAILKASERTGIPPEQLAALISAEAATGKGGQWDPYSLNSEGMAGLTQFKADTWAEQATTQGRYLNEVATAAGIVTAKTNKNGKTTYSVTPGREEDLANLRYDPQLSVITAAEYGKANVDSLKKDPNLATTMASNSDAWNLYLTHHDGRGGAKQYLEGGSAYGRSGLIAQLGGAKSQKAVDAADALIAAENGDAKAAYRKWLKSYIDKKIKPDNFKCSDEKVDGDEAPPPPPPPPKPPPPPPPPRKRKGK